MATLYHWRDIGKPLSSLSLSLSFSFFLPRLSLPLPPLLDGTIILLPAEVM